MTRKIFTLVALVAVLVLGVSAVRVLFAQEHGGMKGMMSMMKDCPMMGAMAQGPDAALRHGEELGLTEEQVQRLEALKGGAQPAHTQMMERMRALHREIRQATEGARFDEAAVRAAFDRMGDLHTEVGVAMLRTQHEVRQILTPEQREALAEQGGEIMDMHGMMGGGMMGNLMENCPMMKGGMRGGHHGMSQEG